jgi:hypothetical protein
VQQRDYVLMTKGTTAGYRIESKVVRFSQPLPHDSTPSLIDDNHYWLHFNELQQFSLPLQAIRVKPTALMGG